MILIEYLIAQVQIANRSFALKAARPRNNNPMLQISIEDGNYVWHFTGLQNGVEEEIDGEPRQDHFDFYIGLDDIAAQRHLFPRTRARSYGRAVDGLRNPSGRVRRGGKQIAWIGAVARLNFEEIRITMPPLKIEENNDYDKILNIDTERSRYPIENGNGRTVREIHFGFENQVIIRRNSRLTIPRISVIMTPRQYATTLEAIDFVIGLHGKI